MSENPYQNELETAGERLGQCMASVSPEEKEVLRNIKTRVEELARDEETRGRYLDRSAIFAAVIAVDDRITNEALIEAAREYLEKDYLFVKHFKEASV
ncbi:MAG: hypothetical protein FJX76_00350 [Armatimonadetes bacterium]|nr:hypothetical protein [Armatimonadota bacterium]